MSQVSRITGLIIFLLCTCNLFAQHLTNMGKDFWIGYGHHVRMANPSTPEKMQLSITSDVATTGKVAIAGIGFEQNFQVLPKQITTIDIPRTAALDGDGLYNLGIHVTAEKPVVVYSFIYVSAVSGATLCLPTNTLGRDYYSVNFDQVSNETNSASYFFVVATDTGTTSVEVTPSETTLSGKTAGVPFVVQLQQGQVYQVLGSVTERKGKDLTGSRIRSVNTGAGCKRLAVFCGSSKISIGCASAGTSDNLYQQIYPTATWSRKYIAVASLQNPNNIFRVIRPDPMAKVTVNNQVIAPSAFTRNLYYQFTGNGTYVIESDRPIMVAQYFPTEGCSGNSSPGDPEMIFLNPVDQNLNQVTLNSMQPAGVNIRNHYLNVVLPNHPAAINSFLLDGANYTSFTPVPSDTAYAFARISVGKGTHNISCDSGFNIIAYGFGTAESYGYSGGARLRNLYQFAGVNHQYAKLDIPVACSGAPFRPAMVLPYQPHALRWRFNGIIPDEDLLVPVADSVWEVNGINLYRYSIPEWRTAPAPGTYPVKLLVTNGLGDGCTTEQELELDWEVHPPATTAFTWSTKGCAKDSVSFQEQYGIQNSLAAKTWFWNLGNGITSRDRNPQLRYDEAGTYTISHAVVNELGCSTDTVYRSLTLHPLPQNRFTTTTPLCAGKPITLTPTSTLQNGNLLTNTWTLADGSTTTLPQNQPVTLGFDATGSYTIRLSSVSEHGCTGTPFLQHLAVNPVPKAGFILPGSCLRDPFSTFTNTTILAGTGTVRYNWNFGDTGNERNQDTAKSPLHRYTATGIYPVQLIATSDQGCSDTLVQAVSINGSLPKADFVLARGKEQCSNQEVVLVNKGSVDVGQLTRLEIFWNLEQNPQWKTVDEQPLSGREYRVSLPLLYQPATTTYRIRVVAASGQHCTAETEQVLTVNAQPQIRFDTIGLVCSGAPFFTLNQAKVTNGLSGNGVYTGAGVSLNGLFNPSRASIGPNNIRYDFVTDQGCRASAVQQVLVTPSPWVNAGPDRTIRVGKTEQLKALSRGANLRIRWSPALGLSDTQELQPMIRGVKDQLYTLTATTAEGCTASDQVMIYAPEDLFIPNSFTPNGDGNNDSWRIPFLMGSDEALVSVFNRDGYCVFEGGKGRRAWDGTCQGAPMPSGTYVYLVVLKKEQKQYKGTLILIR